MNAPKLTSDLQDALEQNDGFVKGTSYVLMTTDMFRETMGVETDADLNESINAVKEAMSDIRAGRTMSLGVAQQALDEKYGVHD